MQRTYIKCPQCAFQYSAQTEEDLEAKKVAMQGHIKLKHPIEKKVPSPAPDVATPENTTPENTTNQPQVGT